MFLAAADPHPIDTTPVTSSRFREWLPRLGPTSYLLAQELATGLLERSGHRGHFDPNVYARRLGIRDRTLRDSMRRLCDYGVCERHGEDARGIPLYLFRLQVPSKPIPKNVRPHVYNNHTKEQAR